MLVPAIKDFCTLSSFSATKTLKFIKVPANKAWFTVYKKMEKLLGLPLIVALFLMLVIPPPISCLPPARGEHAGLTRAWGTGTAKICL